jgi:hypothetical protein
VVRALHPGIAEGFRLTAVQVPGLEAAVPGPAAGRRAHPRPVRAVRPVPSPTPGSHVVPSLLPQGAGPHEPGGQHGRRQRGGGGAPAARRRGPVARRPRRTRAPAQHRPCGGGPGSRARHVPRGAGADGAWCCMCEMASAHGEVRVRRPSMIFCLCLRIDDIQAGGKCFRLVACTSSRRIRWCSTGIRKRTIGDRFHWKR